MVTWVGEACGIGLALQRRDAGVYIHEVIEGGAASRCPDEILIGDQLLQVPWSKATFPSLFSLPTIITTHRWAERERERETGPNSVRI